MTAPVRAPAARREALTREQRQLLRWLQATLVRRARITAAPRLDVAVRLTPGMARHLERWFRRHGWPAAEVRSLRDGTHVLSFEPRDQVRRVLGADHRQLECALELLNLPLGAERAHAEHFDGVGRAGHQRHVSLHGHGDEERLRHHRLRIETELLAALAPHGLQRVLERLDMPPGVGVSGLESDGADLFYCGGGESGRVRAVKRPKPSMS